MEINTISTCDAIEFLRGLPAECAGLVLADPPYSLPKQFGSNTIRRTLEEWVEWSKEWMHEAIRVLSPHGNLMIYSLHQSAAFLHVELHNRGLIYRRQIIWHYENGFSNYRKAPAAEYEVILWFAKDKNSTYDPIRKPYKSGDRLRHKISKNGKLWVPNPDGRHEGDVWNIPTLAGRRFSDERVQHPTQKPLALSSRLVKHFSKPSELLVVPFVGSGSECVAARMHGRNFVGSEINPEFVAIAEERLSRVQIEMGEQQLG